MKAMAGILDVDAVAVLVQVLAEVGRQALLALVVRLPVERVASPVATSLWMIFYLRDLLL